MQFTEWYGSTPDPTGTGHITLSYQGLASILCIFKHDPFYGLDDAIMAATELLKHEEYNCQNIGRFDHQETQENHVTGYFQNGTIDACRSGNLVDIEYKVNSRK